jgi:hypothetical protein
MITACPQSPPCAPNRFISRQVALSVCARACNGDRANRVVRHRARGRTLPRDEAACGAPEPFQHVGTEGFASRPYFSTLLFSRSSGLVSVLMVISKSAISGLDGTVRRKNWRRCARTSCSGKPPSRPRSRPSRKRSAKSHQNLCHLPRSNGGR